MASTKTHFGYQSVPESEKVNRVREVFDSVASRYDLMNDLMSFGTHRFWKKIAIELCGLRPGQTVLDLASGTADLAKLQAKIIGKQGRLVVSDINEAMLTIGRERLIDEGLAQLEYVLIDAQELPFPDNTFDCVTIAFGLRNVTNKEQAIASIQRVLKPGGRLIILEFSKPTSALVSKFYDFYSFKCIPKIGQLITKDADSYQYLAESIRMHPDQETLLEMLYQSGFDHAEYFNLTNGVVAIHRGYKY